MLDGSDHATLRVHPLRLPQVAELMNSFFVEPERSAECDPDWMYGTFRLNFMSMTFWVHFSLCIGPAWGR